MDYGVDSDHDIIATDMLENICDGSQSRPNVNQREAHYKIRGRINKKQSKWKGALQATQNIGKGLHMVFKTFVKGISQDLATLGRIWFRSLPFHSRTQKLC